MIRYLKKGLALKDVSSKSDDSCNKFKFKICKIKISKSCNSWRFKIIFI